MTIPNVTQNEPTTSAGQYLAVPYNAFTGSPSKNDTILDGCLTLPNIFPVPLGSDMERKLAVAWWLNDPKNLSWEVWRGGTLVGVCGYTRIVAGLDALAHFAFWDRELLGRRTLLLKLMRWAFDNLGLQRISAEIPEHLGPVIRFTRVKLGFRYEGETLAARHPKVLGLEKAQINGPAKWTAKWGSRRESAFVDHDGNAHDVVCLRILKEEFDRNTEGVLASPNAVNHLQAQ